jgi:hypothetical protein
MFITHKAGIDFSIHERETVDHYKEKPRDWTMAFHWGADYIPKCLPADLVARIPEIMTEPTIKMTAKQETSFDFINGKTGKIAATVPAASTKRVVKSKLRELCSTGIDVQVPLLTPIRHIDVYTLVVWKETSQYHR